MRNIRHSSEATNYYLKNIKSLSEQDYVEIKYEEFCKEPEDNITKIMKFLNLKSQNELDFDKLIKPRKLELSIEVERMQKYIYKKMKPYFSCWGYKYE